MNRKKIKAGLCTHYRCTADRTSKDRYCAKHRKRADKLSDPARYTYNFLKANARRDRRPFTITLEDFRILGFLKVQLKDTELGYVPGNITPKAAR